MADRPDRPGPSGHPDRPAAPVRLRADDLEWLLALMDTASVSPLEGGDPAGTAAAQRVVAQGATARGFTTRRLDQPPVEHLASAVTPLPVLRAAADPAFLAGQPSLVLGFGEAAPEHRRLVVNFHVDTVGPHLPPRLDGRVLHGRGAVDDKGPGVAAAVGIAAAYAEAPWLAHTVEARLQSVPGEEGGAMGVYGTRWLVERGETGRLMLFAEPTGLRVLDACSATMTPVLRVTGADATDDHPGDGHNATLALGFLACHLGGELDRLTRGTGAKVCVAGVHTGTAHNRVYGTGELLLNIAYFDTATGRRLAAEVDRLAAEAGKAFADRFHGTALAGRTAADWDRVVGVEWRKRGLPALANRDAAMEALLARCGLPRHDGVADGTAFTCDAIWAAGPGRYAAVCGPGSLDGNGAHTPHEHVRLDDLDAYATRVRDLVLAFGEHIRTREPDRTPGPDRTYDLDRTHDLGRARERGRHARADEQ
ncbi:M20/M25/M40 family metallo-hydrolase [Streptomyces sp. G45]|uniref:M20/M25/M40 family metallo-hydrolase n=1 Tax=Streptomyces sp. G45 TaxID=3406627 RepID=UPI003C229B18